MNKEIEITFYFRFFNEKLKYYTITVPIKKDISPRNTVLKGVKKYMSTFGNCFGCGVHTNLIIIVPEWYVNKLVRETPPKIFHQLIDFFDNEDFYKLCYKYIPNKYYNTDSLVKYSLIMASEYLPTPCKLAEVTMPRNRIVKMLLSLKTLFLCISIKQKRTMHKYLRQRVFKMCIKEISNKTKYWALTQRMIHNMFG